MQIGLVGLPLSGKTTFFNLLTETAQKTGLSTSGRTHVGTALVPDHRVDFLSRLYQPHKTTYAQIQFKDIRGFMPGTAQGKTMGLDEVRSCDALVLVVRAFHSDLIDDSVGEPHPYKEVLDCCAEFLLADMAMVENRIARLENMPKPPKDADAQLTLLKHVLSALEEEIPLNQIDMGSPGTESLDKNEFLTSKPLILAVNVDEEELETGEYPQRDELIRYAADRDIEVIEDCGLVEMEISQLPRDERAEFMAHYNLTETGIDRLARAAYASLGLIAFFTVGEDEVRAWTVRRGTPAKKAAGKIHSDIERGFIRAEVFAYEALHEHGSALKVKEKGLFRLEGKEYIILDGDIVSFRFNV